MYTTMVLRGVSGWKVSSQLKPPTSCRFTPTRDPGDSPNLAWNSSTPYLTASFKKISPVASLLSNVRGPPKSFRPGISPWACEATSRERPKTTRIKFFMVEIGNCLLFSKLLPFQIDIPLLWFGQFQMETPLGTRGLSSMIFHPLQINQQSLMKELWILWVVVGCCSAQSLPTTFDIRVLPSISSYADFAPLSEVVCEAYSWGHQLAQVISNAVSISTKQKIRLSGQQVAQCFSSLNNRCKDTTVENIQSAISFASNSGLTTRDCYKNNYLELPSDICKRKCDDGSPFPLVIRPTLLKSIANGKCSGFAVIKFYDQMNYYSSENPTNMKAEGDFYSYKIGEIVGWKDKGAKVTLRLGGNGWGYKGYAHVDVASNIIFKTFSVALPDQAKKLLEL